MMVYRLASSAAVAVRAATVLPDPTVMAIDCYIFDRRPGKTLQDSFVRVYPRNVTDKLSIPYSGIAGLAFTGRDTAAGKSWEAWVKKYLAKKAAGETNIALEPDSLDE